LQSGLSTVLVNCETEEEILADKIVALCLRKFIKARGLWDMVMLEQQGLIINDEWVMAKFKDYKSIDEPLQCLQQRLTKLPAYWKSDVFYAELGRSSSLVGHVLFYTLRGSHETKPLMIGHWKADSLIIVRKHTNKIGLINKVECLERRGLTERKRFQQKISRDSEHGIFSFRFGNFGKSSEAV
jgi:hypothetical protein